MFGNARVRLRTWLTAGAGTVAAVVLAGLLGAFGALHAPPPPLAAGEPVETGQWLVKVERAYVAARGVYGAPVRQGFRALVLEVEMTNRTGQSSKDYFQLLAPSEPIGDPADQQPLIVLTRDATLSPALHPGMTERMAYVWSLPESTPVPARLNLAVSTKDWKERDNLYGLPGWFNERELGVIDLPVGTAPPAAEGNQP
jgi:hypothetical protein